MPDPGSPSMIDSGPMLKGRRLPSFRRKPVSFLETSASHRSFGKREQPRPDTGWRRTREERGVATSALVMLCEWGFQTLNLAAVVLHTLIGNGASERVAQKAGFIKTDVLSDYRHPATPDVGVQATR